MLTMMKGTLEAFTSLLWILEPYTQRNSVLKVCLSTIEDSLLLLGPTHAMLRAKKLQVVGEPAFNRPGRRGQKTPSGQTKDTMVRYDSLSFCCCCYCCTESLRCARVARRSPALRFLLSHTVQPSRRVSERVTKQRRVEPGCT